MAHLNEGKFSNIFKLLSEQTLQLNVTEKFKCIKCNGILINACQSPCGCRFCRKCVDEILTSGCVQCPGTTEDCKSENLSNVLTDYRMNVKISKLLVKCPEQMCGHECQLIEMEEHMRLCSKKHVQCPCHELGCDDNNLVADKINEHMQTKSYNHWTMLLGLIGDLRNEVVQLRRTDNSKEDLIGVMSDDIKLLKDKVIDEMGDKIRNCQVETENSRCQIHIGNNNLYSKIDAIATELNEKIESIKAETNKSLKMETTELSKKWDCLNGKVDGICQKIDDTRKVDMEHVERKLTLINVSIEKYQVEMAAWIDEMIGLKGNVDETRFVWAVDKISGVSGVSWLRISGRDSEYFSPKINQYKMQLRMCNHKSQMLIWLHIHHGSNSANLKWPFEANVTIKIINKSTPGSNMEVTKYCKIPRPQSNAYSHNYKDPFTFPIEDLSTKGLLQGDCCIVECLVDLN